jgi:uncharacterized protein
MEIASVLWHNPHDNSAELCRLLETPGGFALAGTALVPVAHKPARADYRVETDRRWLTMRAHLVLESAGESNELRLDSDGNGHWTLGGTRQPHLDGCLDVDLRLTAATNALPIRRLGPDIGKIVETRAAWVGFPDLVLEPSEQNYERLDEVTYRFRAGDFVADLVVDHHGLVLRYGDGFWTAVVSDPGADL